MASASAHFSAWRLRTDAESRTSEAFYAGWIAALSEIRKRGDREIGEFLLAELGDPERERSDADNG